MRPSSLTMCHVFLPLMLIHLVQSPCRITTVWKCALSFGTMDGLLMTDEIRMSREFGGAAGQGAVVSGIGLS